MGDLELVAEPSRTSPYPTWAPAKIHWIRARWFEPLQALIGRIGRAFGAGDSEIVGITGLPFPALAFRHPSHIHAILAHPGIGLAKPTHLLPRVRHVMGRGAYILNGESFWKEKRRVLQSRFTAAAAQEWMPRLRPVIGRYLEGMAQRISPARPLDLAHEMKGLALSVTCQMLFASQPENLEALQEATEVIERDFVRPTPLWLPTPSNLRFRRAARRLRNLLRELLCARASSQEDANSLAAHLKAACGGSLSEDDLVDELFSVYFGASVIGTTLAWAVHLLSGRPDLWRSLDEETAARVIKETLRLYPASWSYPRFAGIPFAVAGVEVPKGTLMLPMICEMQRHPKIWSQPDCFLPERFAGESLSNAQAAAYLPFGSGPRKCLGEHLAPRILSETLTAMASRFDCPRAAQPEAVLEAELGFEIRPRQGVWLHLGAKPTVCPHGPEFLAEVLFEGNLT